MDGSDTESTNRQGASLAAYRVEKALGWIFREQLTSDYGVDAHVETRTAHQQPTGRLIGVQLKTGPSYFAESNDQGWIHRPSSKHVNYWLQHSLPMYIFLVDLDKEEIYWQRLSALTLKRTKGKGWKILIPRANTLALARPHWEAVASGAEQEAITSYSHNLEVLPSVTIPHIKRLSEVNTVDAALLADLLAKNRTAPDLALTTILSAAPSWLESSDASGWLAVATFAASHQQYIASSEAFRRAATKATDKRGRILAAAGMQLIGVDTPKALELFSEARKHPGGDTVGWIGEIIASHPTSPLLPMAVPDELASRLIRITDDAMCYNFRAQQAELAKLYTRAIQYWEMALRLAPEECALEVRLAHALLRRAGSPERMHDDLSRARVHAENALNELHRWDGPTQEALDTLVRTLGFNGDFDEIIRVGCVAPNGIALPKEANDPDIVIACINAAIMLDRQPLARELAHTISAEPQRSHAEALLANITGASEEDQIHHWTEVLNSCTDEHPEHMVKALFQLASLKIDESARLSRFVELGVVQQYVQDMIRGSAEAHRDPIGGLSTLRMLSDTNPGAAMNLIDRLRRSGQTDEAVAVCERAYRTLKDREFLALKVPILFEANRYEEAEAAVLALLAEPSLPNYLRRELYNRLAAITSKAERYSDAERYCELAIETGPDGREYDLAVWNLVSVQLNQRAYNRASTTVRRYKPTVNIKHEAELWFRALMIEDFNAESAAQALTLALRFSDDPHLSGALLQRIIMSPHEGSSTLQALDRDEYTELSDGSSVVPDELIRQAFAAAEEHIAEHGENSSIKMIRIPSEDDESIRESISSLVAPRNDLTPLFRKAWLGLLPLGALAAVLGRGYAYTLVCRAGEVNVSCSYAEELHDEDLASARASIGKTVIVESSALLVSQLLGEFDRLKGTFADLLMPAVSRDDVVRARINTKGTVGSAGSLGRGLTGRELKWQESTEDARAALQQRMELLWNAANRTQSVATGQLSLFKELPVPEHAPWLAPIQLAWEQKLALWSDDVAVRSVARSMGVRAFGTVDVLDVLFELELENCQDDETIESALAQHRARMHTQIQQFVVDIPVALEDVVHQAENDEWHPGAAAVQVSRPSWWSWSEDPFHEFVGLCSTVRRENPESLGQWLAAGLNGIAAAAALGDPERASTLLASMVLFLMAEPDGRDTMDLTVGVARQIAQDWGYVDPIGSVVQASQLLGTLELLDSRVEVIEILLREYPPV